MAYKGNLKGLFAGTLAILMAMTVTPVNAESSVTRFSGSDRFATSIETAAGIDSDTLVFANGRQFADALSAVNICNALNAKLILVDKDSDMPSLYRRADIPRFI